MPRGADSGDDVSMGWNQRSSDAPTTDPWNVESSATRLNPWVVVGVAGAVLLVAVGALVLVLTKSSGPSGDSATAGNRISSERAHEVASNNSTTSLAPPGPTTSLAVSPSTVATATTVAPTPTAAPAPAAPDADQQARLQIMSIVEQDRPQVDALLDQWVPQLSSKAVGLDVPDDTVGAYTAPMILSDHLAYKDRYAPQGISVLLLHSDDYNFKLPGYWVTVAAVTFPTADAANAWCDAQNIKDTDCFAKELSHTIGWQGSMKSRER